VKTGRFESAEEVIEAAIAQWQTPLDLDEETVAAINAAEEQADRGEGTDLDTFIEQMSKRFGATR
jgi:Arc/MetJ-type ribon-helix-helix transcriptional regulator